MVISEVENSINVLVFVRGGRLEYYFWLSYSKFHIDLEDLMSRSQRKSTKICSCILKARAIYSIKDKRNLKTCLWREQESVAIVGGGDRASGGEWNGTKKSRRYTEAIELVGYITQLHKFVLSYIVVASIMIVVTSSIVNKMGICASLFNFTEVRYCSRIDNTSVSIGSGNGMALIRWQAITWTNGD